MTFRQILCELVSNGPGKAGVAMLVILIALSIYSVARFPFNFGETRWNNPAEWADNPKAVPPSWSNWLSGSNGVAHKKVTVREPAEVVTGARGTVRTYALSWDFDVDEPPTFVSMTVEGLTYNVRPPVLSFSLARPDGTEVVLLQQVARAPRPGEVAPFVRFREEPLRISITTEPNAINAMGDFFRQNYTETVSSDVLRFSMARALVSVPDPSVDEDGERLFPGGLRLLPGTYEFRVTATVTDVGDTLDSVRFVVGGSVFGLMGTDGLGRDLAVGLLFGLPIALFIGIAASVVTTTIGASLGIISGYVGGKTDLAIQRLSDIILNVPLLPLLIFLVFVFGSNLFLIIFFLVAFSWPGLTILIRSMVLQIRSGQLIESAVALGASRWRVMFRHVFPHAAPFIFSQMIFFAPAAILAEAGLSFLGLGDPSIPTWGQILQDGFTTGAVFLGYWWWVVPPGVLIMITAVTFMFLALGLEPVVNPRLRRMN